MTNRTVCIQVAQYEWSWSAMTGMQSGILAKLTRERKKKKKRNSHQIDWPTLNNVSKTNHPRPIRMNGQHLHTYEKRSSSGRIMCYTYMPYYKYVVRPYKGLRDQSVALYVVNFFIIQDLFCAELSSLAYTHK